MTKAFSPTLTIDGVTDVVTDAEGAAAMCGSATGAVVMVGDGVSMGDPVVDVGIDVGVNVRGKNVDGMGVDDTEATRFGVKIGGCAIGV